MAKRCCLQCGKDCRGAYCASCSPYTKTGSRFARGPRIDTAEEMYIRGDDDQSSGYVPPKVDDYNGSTTRDDI